MTRAKRPDGPKLVAIVAARNEADRIGATLDALAAALPGVEALRRRRRLRGRHRRGRDAARRRGDQPQPPARQGRQRDRRRRGGARRPRRRRPTVLLCDADLGAAAGELVPLVEAVEAGECDLAVAAFARREGGGFGLALGYARRARSRSSAASGPSAPISGQRAMRASTLRDLLPFAAGFGMEIGMTVDAVRAGHRVQEIELRSSTGRPAAPSPASSTAAASSATSAGPSRRRRGSRIAWRRDPRDRPGNDRHHLPRLRRATGGSPAAPTPSSSSTSPRPGWVEHDAAEIWEVTRQVAIARARRRRRRGRRPGRDRDHQPARDRRRLGPEDRRADPPRARLAGPPHRRTLRRAARGRATRSSSASAPAS